LNEPVTFQIHGNALSLTEKNLTKSRLEHGIVYNTNHLLVKNCIFLAKLYHLMTLISRVTALILHV